MLIRHPLIATGFMLASFAAFTCDSPSSCNAAGSKLYAQGKYTAAMKSFERQVDLATGEGDENSLRVGLNNLALSADRLGRPLEAHAWLQVAMQRFPEDGATQHNLALVRKRMPTLQPGGVISGIYRRYAGYGKWSVLRVRSIGGGSYQLQFDIFRYGKAPSADAFGPAAAGELEAHSMLVNGRLEASYSPWGESPCNFHLELTELALNIPPQDMPSRCEFGGQGIHLNGKFWLTAADSRP